MRSNPARAETPVTALLAGLFPYRDVDTLVRCITPNQGSVTFLARGLRKANSKLASALQPADELELSSHAGKGGMQLLVGVHATKQHAVWRKSLDLTALYWFMAECAWLASGDEESNKLTYQLTVNLLRNPPETESRHSALCVFVLKLLGLHGLLPDLAVCLRDGHELAKGETLHLSSSSEGLVGLEAYNKYYAPSGATLLRLEAARVPRWRKLAGSPLLEYATAESDEFDAAVLLQIAARLLGDTAGHAVKSAEFLRQQWKLNDWGELMKAQRV